MCGQNLCVSWTDDTIPAILLQIIHDSEVENEQDQALLVFTDRLHTPRPEPLGE